MSSPAVPIPKFLHRDELKRCECVKTVPPNHTRNSFVFTFWHIGEILSNRESGEKV